MSRKTWTLRQSATNLPKGSTRPSLGLLSVSPWWLALRYFSLFALSETDSLVHRCFWVRTANRHLPSDMERPWSWNRIREDSASFVSCLRAPGHVLVSCRSNWFRIPVWWWTWPNFLKWGRRLRSWHRKRWANFGLSASRRPPVTFATPFGCLQSWGTCSWGWPAGRRRCLSSSRAESSGGRPPFPATLTTLLQSHMVKVRALGSPQLSLGDRVASRRRNEFRMLCKIPVAFNHRRLNRLQALHEQITQMWKVTCEQSVDTFSDCPQFSAITKIHGRLRMSTVKHAHQILQNSSVVGFIAQRMSSWTRKCANCSRTFTREASNAAVESKWWRDSSTPSRKTARWELGKYRVPSGPWKPGGVWHPAGDAKPWCWDAGWPFVGDSWNEVECRWHCTCSWGYQSFRDPRLCRQHDDAIWWNLRKKALASGRCYSTPRKKPGQAKPSDTTNVASWTSHGWVSSNICFWQCRVRTITDQSGISRTHKWPVQCSKLLRKLGWEQWLSNNFVTRVRMLNAVQKRGAWSQAKSMHRCEHRSRIAADYGKLPPEVRTLYEECEKHFRQIMLVSRNLVRRTSQEIMLLRDAGSV